MVLTNITLSTQSISSWFQLFFERRGNSLDDTQPLYRLHMTQTEYKELEAMLAQPRSFQTALSKKEWCGAFTLYCAEWFRREYTHNWSWEPIFTRLNMRLTPGEISEKVTLGLQGYWGKSLLRYQDSNRNNYLGSIFKEGGLPSNLLSQNNNNYQSTFNAIFNKYQLLREFGDKAVYDFIQSKITYLPEALRGTESIELIRDMVEKLDSFVYQYNLDKQKEPVNYLETNYPRWREAFPLPLDNETGTQFLKQLLSRATEEARKVANKRQKLRCKHYISFDNQCVTSDILLPDSLRFDITRIQLTSSRIELAIFEGERHLASLGTGFAQFDNQETVVRIRQSLISIVRESTDSELYIVALQSGQQLAKLRLKGSTVDYEESPITLVENANRWLIAGQATTLTKVDSALVLIPNEVQHELQRGQFTPNQSLSFKALKTYHLAGKVSLFFSSGDKFIITTGAERYSEDVIFLKGNSVRWKTNPPLVFKGVPRIATQDLESEISNLGTYLNGKPKGKLNSAEMYGRQLLSVKNSDNEVLLRKRIGILPNDFKLALVPGTRPTMGKLVISSQVTFVAKVRDKNIDSKIKKTGNGNTEIHIAVNGTPPSTFTLNIHASLLHDPIEFNLPFPSVGVTTYDNEGNALSSNLAIEDLVGSRINLFAQQGRPTRYEITLLDLSHGKNSRRAASFSWRYRVTDKPIEISLYSLKDYVLELLSLSENLDSKVELSINGNGQTQRFIISYYSVTVSYNHTNQQISLNSYSLRRALKTEAVLMDLTKPEQKPIPLPSCLSENVETGAYQLPELIRKGGPWLVLPAEGSQIMFRACFIPGNNEDCDIETIETLQNASRVFNPRDDRTSISIVVSQMAKDWNHSGWEYLKNTWRHYEYLPMSTFEVWRHLVRNPSALALALFKFDMNPQFIAKLESQLPVIWEFIPLQCWLDAKHLFLNEMQQLGLTSDLQSTLLDNKIESLVKEIPSLAELSSYLKEERLQPLMSQSVMQATINGSWYQELLRQHSEDSHWPDDIGDYLKKVCLELSLCPIELTVNSSYQNGVVFAPIFAAGIACQRIPAEMLLHFKEEKLFEFRRLIHFDRDWFRPLYTYAINYYLNNESRG
ncbi:STY4851/ECs_5259 family protein [Paraferrimonas haliotis]|uniref:STY4851/ECs_5259 family protein n=1 Tax=Paraferrimonas haliotis TaxID=2013866 RepID=UPI000BA95379|nr:STY4851/ECs_5259 family protein [Paraferrimonas haliotis]